MKDYFETNECTDYKLLEDFNDHTHMFDRIRRTKEGHHTDAVGYHTNKMGEKRTFNIELKKRNMLPGTYPTVFIEDYKLASMLIDYHIYNTEPLYINFLDDDYVVIFNLLKLKKEPEVEIKNIYSQGKDKMQQQERRYGLDLKDAVIYHHNNLVKPMGKKWKTKQQYS